MAAKKETNTEVQTETPPVDMDVAADKMIRNCSLASVGAAIFPIPVVDIVALGGVQVYLIRELCKIYELPFDKEQVRSILGAIVGGVSPVVVTPGVVALTKFLPGIGTLAAALTLPALSIASTVAVGRIFKKHFAAGGTLSDVDVDEMSAEYEEEVEKAKDESSAKKSNTKEAAAA